MTSARETGWLPDLVLADGKFEEGLAFFADELGRITRFSREAVDLAAAKRLEGQAALPGLVNAHSRALHRLERGRGQLDAVLARLGAEDVYDTARMAFLEMLLSGITCVGEFHELHHQPDGQPWPEPNLLGRAVLQAARETGIRIALFKVANAGAMPVRSTIATPEQFIREMDALRGFVAREHPGDETWLGLGIRDVPPAYLREISAYAHAQRLRVHVPASLVMVRRFVEQGAIDKRVTFVRAGEITDEDVNAMRAARAAICACPTAETRGGSAIGSLASALPEGVDVALGTDTHAHMNLLGEARCIDVGVAGPAAATARLHAATVAGARSLGAPSGALEIGRPADFFTVNLYDPSLAGAGPEGLLDCVLSTFERRMIREVWVGARPRVSAGRHVQQGPIVGRFVNLQRRLRDHQ